MGTAEPLRVLVCGEALVDLVPTADRLLAPVPGGGPFNAAVALGRLGAPAGFLSRLSTDPFGALLHDRLRAAGVDTTLVQRGDEPTTLALTSLDRAGAARYTFYAEGTADRLVTDPGPLPASVAAVSFGTLSLVYEPGASVYEQLLHRVHDQGRLTVLDPNVRATAIPDARAYRERFATWLPSTDILKVSTDDAGWLGGTPDDWLAAGVGAVLLTRGAAGLTVFTPGARCDVAALPVAVADTIGAGDTVHAALLAWLERVDLLHPRKVRDCAAAQWEQALAFAARAAAVTVSRPGADPPWADELTCD